MSPLKLVTLIILGAASLLPHSVEAADSDRFQLTVFDGYAFGGSFENNANRRSIQIEPSNVFGITLDMRATQDMDEFRNAYYELTYRKQSTELDPALFGLDVENLHVGGRLEFYSQNPHLIPHFSITVGGTRFSPSLSTLKEVTKFSIGIGGGFKVPLVKNVALQFDVRAYTTFINSDADAFCLRRTDGATPSPEDDTSCIARWSSSLLLQGEGTIGLTIGF